MTEQRRPFNLRGHLILVVEDDYFVADDLCRELEDQGVNVLGPVPSVADALALLAREERPDIAVLDVKLGDEVVYPLADVLMPLRCPLSSPRPMGSGTYPKPTPGCRAARSRSTCASLSGC